MTPTARPEPKAATRRFGYFVAVLINAVILYLLNIRPGWQTVPFLTDETTEVISVVNASLIASLAVNAVYLLVDPPWLKAVGGIVSTIFGLVALERIFQVFPFDFADSSIDWSLVTRIVLIVAIIGSVIGIVVGFVTLTRTLFGSGSKTGLPARTEK